MLARFSGAVVDIRGRFQLSSSSVAVMGEQEEAMQLAQARLADVVEHLRILAADAETQNAWLHPCGWTCKEPYVHFKDRKGCVPVDELYLSFDDIWPMWRSVLEPVLTPALEDALNRLLAYFQEMHDGPHADWVDEPETLDRLEWADVRRLAAAAIAVADDRQPD